MSLEKYLDKRDLKRSPEPSGGSPSKGRPHFVVQKHQASHLHYDFRLEMDGVLKSWALPKGPSMNPNDKRLAVMVEDHPLDYRNFEGQIPAGQYGAGSVEVWDSGTYADLAESGNIRTLRRNIKSGLENGDLKFVLDGTRLKGAFVLVRIKSDDKSWLLIKKKDQFAAEIETTEAVLEDFGPDVENAPRAVQPATLRPMLATLASKPFDNPDWIYEIKWDGYRIMAHVSAGNATLWSRSQKDYTDVFNEVARQLMHIRLDCILDGEMCVIDDQGRASFGALQNYQRSGKGQLIYYVFDVPYADGRDLRRLPLYRRKDIAERIIRGLDRVRMSDHVSGRGIDFFAAAKSKSLEGVMAKETSSPYLDGKRSRYWLKVRNTLRTEAVIGGFTERRGSNRVLGALVLGIYADSQLQYIGNAGSSMNQATSDELYKTLSATQRKTSPFKPVPKTDEPAHWVSPRLVCEVEFTEWTETGHLRHPIYVGLRDDKEPKEVIREEPVSPVSDPAPKGEIKHPDKVFWKEGITKGDLAGYYEQMAETIMPYLRGRPEALNRHPNGPDGKSFFQKDLASHPDWVRTLPIYSESTGKDINWLICDDKASLMYMVNLGCIELNPWLSREESLERPDFCLIDLDAKTTTFQNVIRAAQATHEVLDRYGIPAYPKTSGKTGLHIGIPLGAKYTYEQSRQLAELLVNLVHERTSDFTSVERSPDKRVGLIYLDYLQNRKGQTMAAPYCVRPVPGATVSMPLNWSEVRAGLDPTMFTIETAEKRLREVGDLWEGLLGPAIDIGTVLGNMT